MKLKILNWSIYGALLIFLLTGCQPETNSLYSVADRPWEESLGNHRAVLQVEDAAEAALIDIDWRRHDRDPAEKRFIIIHEGGDTIQNIHRIAVDNERCKLAFGPLKKPGKYFFYYLPYLVQENYGFYNKGYLKPEAKPAADWENKLDGAKLLKTKLIGFQSRTAFDSFYPMEVIALKSEKDSLLNKYSLDFLIFPEDRLFPIRMLDEIPLRWIESGPSTVFKGEALKNEYYAFQLGVFAARKDLQDIKIEFSGLQNGDHKIAPDKLTCFNTGGIGPYGDPFVKRVDLPLRKVQPLWIGVDLSKDIPAGTYTGTATVWAENTEKQTVELSLKIGNEVLADRGDSEAWRHSRLRWLNSTLGIDDEPTNGYKPISFIGESTYGFTGKTMTIADNGFPSSFKVKETEVLNRPISFVVETPKGQEQFSEPQNIQLVKNAPGKMIGAWESYSDNLKISGVGTIEADGYINYKLSVEALKPVDAKDIRLEIPFKKEVAEYMMGMDLPGGVVPKKHSARWNGPHDSFWVGNTHAGLWCELRGSSYSGPLLNLYRPDYPASWYNNDQGGFRIESTSSEVKALVYSGKRSLEKGEELTFEWSMLLTPVKDIDYKSQFTNRYYHNGGQPVPSDEDLESGVKIVNLHHANNYNPHINYPFVAVDSMKWFVDRMHAKGQKVKIYYTIRELTNYTTELWALRSLGDEILGDGRGSGYPWLREHLVSNYRPQWYQWFPDKSADASIVNAPGDSRWYNYYIEGLAWLVRHVDIDGLYLDDVSYDRRTVKRIRKVLDREKPGCLIDLHSNTGFSKGPATQYTEYFPYMDKLWFGESFMYSDMEPANWLVEVSGIPFGLMGDMLHGGGNRWLGMVYGMTVRHPWVTEGVTCDPRPVWKVWDEFGIEQSQMIGFWEKEPVVLTNNSQVKATAYIREGKTLIALGNWSDKTEKVQLNLDWNRIGFSSAEVKLIASEIADFQPSAQFAITDEIPIESKKGWLLIIEEGK